MKKLLSALLLLALLLSVQTCLAENKEKPASPAAGGEYDEIVLPAIEALKDAWREIYGEYPDMYLGHTGYLEIKNTRILRIREDLSGAKEAAETLFGDVDCLVEFMLYTDYYGSEPYYAGVGMYDCVALRRDGAVKALSKNPLEFYRSRTYDADYSGIIEEIIDLNGEYNAAYHLLAE